MSEIEPLTRYAFDGKAEIAITTPLETEQEQDKNEDQRRALIAMLTQAQALAWRVRRVAWPGRERERSAYLQL